MEFFPTHIIRKQTSTFVLWCGNDSADEDHIYIDNGVVRTFSSIEELLQFAIEMQICLTSHKVDHSIDCDRIARWIDSRGDFSPVATLNLWNFLLDFWNVESTKWRMFRELSAQHLRDHCKLSEIVLNEYLSTSASPPILDDDSYTRIAVVMRAGICALDGTLEG